MTSADEPGPAQPTVTIVIAPDESRAEVTFQGSTQVVTGSAPKETRRDALEVATRHALALGRPVRVSARDFNGEWQLVVTPDGIVHAEGGEAPEHKLPKGPRPMGRGRRALRIAGIGVLALGLVAAAGGVVVWLLPDTVVETSGGDGSSVAFDSRPPPPGYAAEAAWSLPITPEAGAGVTPERDLVTYVDQEEQLVVAAPNGSPEWSEALPFDIADAEDAPQFVRDGDGYGVALVVGDVLYQWPEGGGDPVEYDVPSDTAVSFAGRSALLSNDEVAYVPVDGELQEVPVTAPAGPLVADGDRVLMAELHEVPWSWVTPDGSATEVDPDTPPGADGVEQVMTARADHVIVRWEAESGGDVVLAVHDANDGSVVASHETDPADIEEATWVEGDTLAAYGPILVNLDDGSTASVDGFQPVSAAGDTVFGAVGSDPVAVGANASPVELEENTARPWGLLDGHAVVVADDHLYALSPK